MKMKKFQFDQLIDWANELSEKSHVWVRVDMLTMFCEFVRGLGFNPQGGALSDDCTQQCVYIDRN